MTVAVADGDSGTRAGIGICICISLGIILYGVVRHWRKRQLRADTIQDIEQPFGKTTSGIMYIMLSHSGAIIVHQAKSGLINLMWLHHFWKSMHIYLCHKLLRLLALFKSMFKFEIALSILDSVVRSIQIQECCFNMSIIDTR